MTRKLKIGDSVLFSKEGSHLTRGVIVSEYENEYVIESFAFIAREKKENVCLDYSRPNQNWRMIKLLSALFPKTMAKHYLNGYNAGIEEATR